MLGRMSKREKQIIDVSNITQNAEGLEHGKQLPLEIESEAGVGEAS